MCSGWDCPLLPQLQPRAWQSQSQARACHRDMQAGAISGLGSVPPWVGGGSETHRPLFHFPSPAAASFWPQVPLLPSPVLPAQLHKHPQTLPCTGPGHPGGLLGL